MGSVSDGHFVSKIVVAALVHERAHALFGRPQVSYRETSTLRPRSKHSKISEYPHCAVLAVTAQFDELRERIYAHRHAHTLHVRWHLVALRCYIGSISNGLELLQSAKLPLVAGLGLFS